MTNDIIINPYSVLALPTNATTDDVEQTYLATVRQYHPDILKMRSPGSISWAKTQFIALTRARDVLADPASRRTYDAQSAEAEGPTMYTFAYGYVDAKGAMPWLTASFPVDYDKAWNDFISKPFGWTKKGSPSLNRWSNGSWLGLLVCVIAGVVIFAGMGYSGPLLYMYLATTRSSPMIMSYIPFIAGLVGAGLGVIVTLGVVIYQIVKNPHSARRSGIFWRFILDLLSSLILTLTMSLAFLGMVIGYYLF